LKLKFRRHPELSAGMGRMMALKVKALGADTVTFVPMLPEKKRQRGYDQAELLAKAVAGSLKRPCKKLLEKSEGHAAQHTLGEQQRRENVRGLFSAAKPGEIRGKRILLVDDVFTTGATSGECARILLAAGAKSVSLAVVAIADHTNNSR
jgi:ComF family protein